MGLSVSFLNFRDFADSFEVLARIIEHYLLLINLNMLKHSRTKFKHDNAQKVKFSYPHRYNISTNIHYTSPRVLQSNINKNKKKILQ